MSTIYQTLKDEHDRHRELLAVIADTSGDTQERRSKWDTFYNEVSAHAAAEEETLYSKLIAKEDGQPAGRHSVAEHKELDDLMAELNEIEFSSPGWLTKFKSLKDRYEHHIEEEENDIFPEAKELVGKDKSGQMAEAFEERKDAELKLVDEKAEGGLDH